MPEAAAGPDTYSCQRNGQVFLLTEAGVLVQELGTRLWRSVPATAGTPTTPAPTPSQVRSLRQNPGRRRRPSPWAGTPARPASPPHHTGEATVTLEIYNPLTATWSTIPQGVKRTQVGEAVCCTLPDGRLLIGAVTSGSCSTYDPYSNQWSTTPPTAGAPRRAAGLSSVIAVRMSD